MAGFQTTPWRLISGILGVMCLVLMATLGKLLKDCSSCQKMWIGYQCNCYFISNEMKTWEESKDFCASKNSSLLQLQNKDELDFMNHISQRFYWIGLSYSKEHSAWLWEDGSALSQTLFSFPETVDIRNCIVYSPNDGFLD
ncbi:natural killer cells antigen CD94-like isoform X2 [Pteropus medius]|uniref:natural killer cells antigen CD94-like isoform X2 n=1 Tax=Pteropus vampyrus TaxID=132908 RepID=UPI00196A4572|nr:natural killer cells antigen CD94-like isoform X2 [Pteropus giganteus]